MDREKIIEKVKLLFKLAESPNENESANAKALAEAIIEKHNLQPSELKDNTFNYPEENILFRSFTKSFWRNRLAIVLATQFFCYIIEQKITANTSIDGNELPVEEFIYFLYGEDKHDVGNVKQLYSVLEPKIDSIITEVCKGRGGLFCESFSEGFMNSIKYRIENGDFDFKIQELKEEAAAKPDTIVKQTKTEFPSTQPVENKRDIVEDKKPIDIIAYFKGEQAGMKLELGELLKANDIDIKALMEADEEEDEETYEDEPNKVNNESIDFLSELVKKLGLK